MAVFGDRKLVVMTRRRKTFSIDITEQDSSDEQANPCCVWGLSSLSLFEPLVIFTDSRLLHILNVRQRKIVSTLAGHGGPITSITVHPIYPYIFCTTSRDFTTRIYDLTLPPRQTPNNPHWPPGTRPSRGGAPAGMHSSEPEGYTNGVGRCVAILAGGRSGGHQAAVLNSAFHPTLPLLATCGVDRFVKIWRLPSLEDKSLAREDKPLFSSSRIHQSRVLSVTWLNEDTLLSHCAPVLLRTKNDGNRVDDQFDTFPGTLALWRWLGLSRFFQPGAEPYQKNMRGCASDYQESASFKFVAEYLIPKYTKHLHVYQSPTHDPIVILALRNELRIVNVTKFRPRPPQPFPYEEPAIRSAKRRRISGAEEVQESEDESPGRKVVRHIEEVPGWTLCAGSHDQIVVASAMGTRGYTISALGWHQTKSCSTIWRWILESS